MKIQKTTSKSKKYDVRVVRFEKTSNRISGASTVTLPKWDYICLGHFDRVTAEPLNSQFSLDQSPLQRIGKNQYKHPLSDDNYVFSMYLLKEITEDNYCDDFWGSNSKFCAIIRLHCDLTNGDVANGTLLKQIEDYFCNLKNSPVNYSTKGKLQTCGTDVSYILYDSLELGDAVVILKSDSIVATLEVARCLNFNNYVRDTYTYCLIQTELLKRNAAEETAASDNSPTQDETQEADAAESVDHSPILDYASTRFAIREAYAADQFLRDLGIKTGNSQETPKAYFITGTTDLIVEWGPCSETDFVQYVRKITQKGILPNTSKTDEQKVTVQTAFNDVITRIGVNHMNKPSLSNNAFGEKHSSEIVYYFISRVSPDEISFCYNKLKLPSYLPFEHSFKRILGTLESMYHNSVTDDLYNLLYPSTRAMINRLSCMEEAKEQDEQQIQYQRDLIRYLETWELLAGDITNLESQLVHHPELQVVRYYAPAMVLQFELEFAILCSKLLSEEASRCFIPMLALSQNPAVSTECLLDPLDEQYHGECALITQIPTQMLYNPWKVAHQLCHEVSHYSGDDTRNRIERKNVLCECMAEWITRYWSEPYIDKIPSIADHSLSEFRKFCNYFKRKLFKKLQQALGSSADTHHLEVLCERILLCCYDISNDSQLREEFQSNALSYASENEQLAFLGEKASAVNATAYPMMIELDDIARHLEYLKNCLKEGYADISMITLLNCSNDSYIECVYAEEMERVHQSLPADIRRKLLYEVLNPHIDRFALVYAARQKSRKRNVSKCIKKVLLKQSPLQAGDEGNNKDGWLQRAKTRAANALSALQGDTKVFWEKDIMNLHANHLLMPEATAIINYFVGCIEALQHFIDKKDKQQGIKQLRQVLNAVRPDFFDWSELQKFLLQARERRKEEYQKEVDENG